MESIGNLLPRSEVVEQAERTLQFNKRWLNRGFTQVPNGMLRNTKLSIGAKLLYILLMSRCFSKDFSYPGVETLTQELGVTNDTFYSYKKELEDIGWITIKRRGQGKTNIYILNEFK